MTITEDELAVNVQNKVVRHFMIKQTKNLTYNVIVELTWRKEQLKLINSRKEVKEWVSLDRLIAHIQRKYGIPPPITLFLSETD